MKVSLCDKCGEQMDDSGGDRGRIGIYIELGPQNKSASAGWREFHRSCARNLTIAQIYNRKGVRPL